jgi:hypothetical protein
LGPKYHQQGKLFKRESVFEKKKCDTLLKKPSKWSEKCTAGLRKPMTPDDIRSFDGVAS